MKCREMVLNPPGAVGKNSASNRKKKERKMAKKALGKRPTDLNGINNDDDEASSASTSERVPIAPA